MVAADLHPGYFSHQFARALAESAHIPLIEVQHHHAHIVSTMAENRLEGPVIGLSFDGTGLGTDGKIWGGEILAGDLRECHRIGHFEPVPLPGGDAAIRAPWR